LTNHSRM